jgi:hypothetical protein
VFYINGEAKCYNTIDCRRNVISINGWHTGYGRHRKGLKIFRNLKWNTNERSILIVDWLEKDSTHEIFQLTWCFLINPLWKAVISDNGVNLTHNDELVYFEDLDKLGLTLGSGHYCPSYQTEYRCQSIKASCKAIAGEKVSFLIKY